MLIRWRNRDLSKNGQNRMEAVLAVGWEDTLLSASLELSLGECYIQGILQTLADPELPAGFSSSNTLRM